MIKKIVLTTWGVFVVLCLFAQSVDQVLPDRVRVKLKSAAYTQMTQLTPSMKTHGVGANTFTHELVVGLTTLDALNKNYQASSMQRVFPHAGKHEAKQQQAGLHLWYDILVESPENPVELAKIYTGNDNVELAEPVLKITQTDSSEPLLPVITAASYTPNDPDYDKQWHYNNTGQTGGTTGVDIRLPEAWQLTKGKNTVIVAVVDQGVDFNHDDLKANMWTNEAELHGTPGVDDDDNGYIDDIYGFNFVDGYGFNPSANPIGPADIVPGNHGTHVAGTVAGVTNNAKGIAGVAGGDGAGNGIRIMSCQTLMENVKKGAYITAAIAYAANNGAVILQNSWGFDSQGTQSQSVLDAIRYFIRYAGTDESGNNPLPGTPMKGGIVIFAAGNDNSSGDWYPPRYDEVLAVSSVNHYGQKAYYSNYGDWVDISAPGGDTREKTIGGVLSTTINNNYGYMQGTSMACPHVSGIAALVLSRFGATSYTPDKLWNRLINAVNPLDNDSYYQNGLMGTGLVDASQAVADYVPATGITLPATTSVFLARAATLTATIVPANATDRRITWASANGDIATVSNKGVITGIGLGTTTITATTVEGSYTATSLITVIPVPLEDIATTPPTATIKLNEERSLYVTYTPSDASDKTVTWSSSDLNVVTVNNNGLVTPVGLGTATVTATAHDGGYQSTSTITIVQSVTGVVLQPDFVKLVVGDTLSIQAIIQPSNAYDKKVVWSSQSLAIATVGSTGKIQAKKAGETRISVRTDDGGYTASANVFVYDAAQAPQGFSPNGDGINDYFVITLDSRDSYTLRVFDKSGQVHYQSTDYRNDWEGTANAGPNTGAKVRSGTYFYTLVTNKTGSAVSGYVVIKY